MGDREPLPSVAERLGPLLARLAAHLRPVFLASLERRAADRYLEWARRSESSTQAAGLRRCADREREIAARVEQLFPMRADERDQLGALGPEVSATYPLLFEGRPLADCFAIQAAGERAGAAVWRSLASGQEDPSRCDTLLACADLEEASAGFLEGLLAASGKEGAT